MALREMLAQFSIAVEGLDQISHAEKKIDQFGSKLGALSDIGKGLAAGAALVAVGHLIGDMVSMGNEIDKISQRLGVSSQELQQWRYMAEQTGAKANDLTLAMKMLETHIGDAVNGQKNKGFDHLGLQLRNTDGTARTAIDVMGDLADKVAGMKSEAEKTALALHTMGKGGIALLPLLKLGREGVERLTKRFHELGGGLSEEFVRDAAEAKAAQIDLSYATMFLKDHIGTQLIPAVTWITHKMADWVAVLGHIVHNTQSAKTVMLGLGVTSAVTAAKIGAGIASKLGLVAPLAEGASRGILGTAQALGKLGLAGLRVAIPLIALFLIVEDLYTFLEGGESVTGHIIEAIFGEGSAEQVRKDLQGIKDDLIGVFENAKPYLMWFAKQTALFLRDMFHGFKGYGKMFSEFFELLGQDIDNWWKKLETDHPVLTKLLNGVKAIGNPLDPIRQLGNVADVIGVNNLKDAASNVVSGVSGRPGGNVTQNNDTKIEVNTANAADAAKGVLSGIGEAHEDNAATLNAIVRW